MAGAKSYDETSIQRALLEIKELGVSRTKAARNHKIPRSTLRYRLKGTKAARAGHERQQKLSAATETFLCNWILDLRKGGCGPTHKRIRDMALKLIKANGPPEAKIFLGKDCVNRFLKRHPELLRAKAGTSAPADRASTPPPTPPLDLAATPIFTTTPQSSRSIRTQISLLGPLDQSTRLFFRAVQRGFHELDVQIAQKKELVETLQRELEVVQAARAARRKAIRHKPSQKKLATTTAMEMTRRDSAEHRRRLYGDRSGVDCEEEQEAEATAAAADDDSDNGSGNDKEQGNTWAGRLRGRAH